MGSYGDVGKRTRSSASPDSVKHQVHALKRKHQDETALDAEEGGQIFWSKKVEHDLVHGKRNVESARQLEAERLAELERVRARRCGPSVDLLSLAFT
jgi:hypothetical protein